ncbi:MAG: anthranilate phosphoribosyltransferase [Halioglobus sp.]|jgi:anthranilate phosphoribosyltransferase
MTNTNPPASSEHPFAPYVRILGKGKSGSRSLSQTEARDALGMILRGEVEPLQVGAFLMLLRVKEETGEELAGFVQACRDNLVAPTAAIQADLDWSSYAGKKHQHPWFLLSILLLTDAGYRIFVHGSAGHTQGRLYTENAMRELGLPVADSWGTVQQQLDTEGFSYLSLGYFCAGLEELMQLRPLLGLRSPVNTLARLINPLACEASVQSVFHPAYAALHQQADQLLGQPTALVFKGESGEVEIKPHADTQLIRLHEGHSQEIPLTRTQMHRAASVNAPAVAPLRALWQDEAADPYGIEATLATAAAALLVLKPELDVAAARAEAAALWNKRNPERLN